MIVCGNNYVVNKECCVIYRCVHETWYQDNSRVFMSDMAGKFSPPKEMSFTGNLSENWNKWKKEFNLYVTATEAHHKSNEVKTSRLLSAVGEKARGAYYTFTFDNEEDSIKLEVVLKKLNLRSTCLRRKTSPT